METQLVKIVQESGLEKSKGEVLLEKFSNFFEIAADWEKKAQAVTVTSVTQIAEMKMAREGRLFLKGKRVEVENTRKTLKEQSLREGQTIDSIARILKNLIEPIENYLEQQEKFAEIQEMKRKAELKAQREIELQPFSEFVFSGVDYGSLSDAEYQKILNGAKLQMQAKIEAEQKAEQERIAKEKAEAAERERMRVENERLKSEALAKEKQLADERAKAEAERKAMEEKARKEREASEAKLRDERLAKEKLEAEIKAKADAELKAKKEAEVKAAAELKALKSAEKKAKAAPDREKLMRFAKEINDLPLPELKSDEATKILSDTLILLKKVVNFITEKTNEL